MHHGLTAWETHPCVGTPPWCSPITEWMTIFSGYVPQMRWPLSKADCVVVPGTFCERELMFPLHPFLKWLLLREKITLPRARNIYPQRGDNLIKGGEVMSPKCPIPLCDIPSLSLIYICPPMLWESRAKNWVLPHAVCWNFKKGGLKNAPGKIYPRDF